MGSSLFLVLSAVVGVGCGSEPGDDAIPADVTIDVGSFATLAAQNEIIITATALAEAAATREASTSTPAQGQSPIPAGVQAVVMRVIDGDTIEIEGGIAVRYIGMDTPEASGECFAQEATARNEALVLNRVVELERDVSETDPFGRLLRYVYVDGVLVNELLVAEGYAEAVAYPPDVKYQGRLDAAESQASAEGLGLWSACASPTAPPVAGLPTQAPVTGSACPQGCVAPPVGCVIKGNISQSSGEKIYHVPGGGSYEATRISPDFGERWFCTEQEAVANGWRKARN